MLRSLVAGVAMAAIALPAAADDFHLVQYQPMTQMEVACPVNLLCVLRLQPGETVTNGLNSSLASWDSNQPYEGTGDQRTPYLTFKPAVPGLRSNVIIFTDRRTYVFLLESTTGTHPTYLRFTFDTDRVKPQGKAKPAPRPKTIAEQFTGACSWFAASALGETYSIGAGSEAWRPVVVCHDSRATWAALAPSTLVGGDLPTVLEQTPSGERLVNYTIFGPDRLIRIDGVGDAYVLQVGRDVVRVRRVTQRPAVPVRQATALSAPSAPDVPTAPTRSGVDHGP